MITRRTCSLLQSRARNVVGRHGQQKCNMAFAVMVCAVAYSFAAMAYTEVVNGIE